MQLFITKSIAIIPQCTSKPLENEFDKRRARFSTLKTLTKPRVTPIKLHNDMGKRRRRLFPKRKRSVFSRPHPMRRKIALRHRKMKAFLHRHSPKIYLIKSMRKMVGGIYNVSDKVKDKIAESTLALDNPFSAHFYGDRCCIQQ